MEGLIHGVAYFWNFTVYYFIDILVAIALIIIPTITALTLLLIPGKEADLFKFFFSVKKILEKIFITITNIYTIYTNRVR